MFAGQEMGPMNFSCLLSGPVFCHTISLSDEFGGTLDFFSFSSFKFLK